ncbi:MAG: hypothetical protein U1E63_09165 [Burkholderiales bacterium]
MLIPPSSEAYAKIDSEAVARFNVMAAVPQIRVLGEAWCELVLETFVRPGEFIRQRRCDPTIATLAD